MRVTFVAGEGDPSWEIAGLTLAERTRRALDRAGVDVDRAGVAPHLVLARDALLEPGAVRALAAEDAPDVARVVAEGPGGGPVAGARLPADVAVPADAADLATLVAKLRADGRLEERDAGGARCERIRSHADAVRSEREMLAVLIQPTDGFFARYFDRRLSIPLSLGLLRLGVRPNSITLFATGVGLLGAWLLAVGGVPVQVLGALLFIASTILDGCDGEVARLGLLQSDFGRKLDLTCDNVVNVAVFAAVGWVAVTGDPGGATRVAVAMTLFGVAFASAVGFWYSGWLERSGRDPAALNAYESLASRDWAYLVLVLALFGKLPWLVWAAAVGSNAVALLLIALRLRGWPPRAQAPASDERGVGPAAEAGGSEWS